MRCLGCGLPYQLGDRFCGGCGRALTAPLLRRPNTTATPQPTVSLLAIFTALCAVFIVIGSFGPWAQVLFAVRNGVEGDGQITLALGVLAGVLAVLRIVRPTYGGRLIGLVAGVLVLSAVIAVVDWVDLSHRQIDERTPLVGGIAVKVGWGLQMVAVASITGSVIALLEMWQQVVRPRFAFWRAAEAAAETAEGQPEPAGLAPSAAPADYIPSAPAERCHGQ